MFINMFEKTSKKRKNVQNDICPINVRILKFYHLQHLPIFFIFLTHLGSVPLHLLFFLFLDKPRAYTARTNVLNLFYAPNITKLGFSILDQYCHQRSDNYIAMAREF